MTDSASTFDVGEPHPVSVDVRGALAAQLLDADPARRREALRAVRMRRLIDVHDDVTVRCVLASRSPARHRNLGHLLASSGRTHTLVTVNDDALILVTSAGRTDLEIEDWVRATARDAGIDGEPVIGSARLHDDDDDIRRAVDDARATAELLARVGTDAIGTHRAEDLGLWRLLHGMNESPELIAAASPAADELRRSADPVRRTTIEAYLDAGCNVAIASRALFVHRTTLYYRLESMPVVVREALADGMKRSALHITLKLLRLWEAASGDALAPHADRAPAPITRLHSRQSSERRSAPRA